MDALFRLDRTHVAAAAEPLTRAFHDDPIWTALFPDPEERALRTRPLFTFMLKLGVMTGEVWSPSERLEGAAVWMRGRVSFAVVPSIRCGALGTPFFVGLKRLPRFGALGAAISRVRKLHAPFEHRYLAMLGVGPEHQRNGLGTALLEPMLARSDREGLPVWLETETEWNVRFYGKFGFDVAQEFTVPELGITMWGMLRHPRAKE